MRERALNDAAVGEGQVVYWMTSQRRLAWNHALDHAILRAQELETGLVILEPLRADYPFASERFHTFIRQGMEVNQAACDAAAVAYHPYIEPKPGAGKGLLAAYAKEAALVVADDHPGFFFPHMLAAAAKLPVRVEAIDSIGMLPLSVGKTFVSAYQFRRFWQKHLLDHLQWPDANPLEAAPPGEIPTAAKSWQGLDFPDFDQHVPATSTTGGRDAGLQSLDAFDVDQYPERNHPDEHAQSGLSPYLHFGHIGAQEVVHRILAAEQWNPSKIGEAKGQREGWWGLSEGAEAFLDQVITWRELGHMEARHNRAWQRFDSLPAWAQATLSAHEIDRDPPYTLDQLEQADTADEIWNAAQRQLLTEGTIHNYLRMLWGKKILEWAPSAEQALTWMLHLNDKYALDGRDPNSVSGIFWCLGRYDRGWQERAVFGKVRCMKSANTKRKLRMNDYLETWNEVSG